MEENAELRRQLELSKQTEEELARRNNLYQKTIKTLVRRAGWRGAGAVGGLNDVRCVRDSIPHYRTVL